MQYFNFNTGRDDADEIGGSLDRWVVMITIVVIIVMMITVVIVMVVVVVRV